MGARLFASNWPCKSLATRPLLNFYPHSPGGSIPISLDVESCMKSRVILFLSVLLPLASSSSQTNSAASAWTFVQAGHCVAGGGASSCKIDLDSNLTPGNLYVFLAYLHSDATNNVIGSVSANGMLVKEPGCQGRSQVAVSPNCAYILPSTSGGGMSPITVHFSQTTAASSQSWVYIAEFHPNTSGYINLDNAGSFYQSARALVGPPFTASASSDVTCEAIISSDSNFIQVNAVSPPYDANAYLPGAFLGFSCAASKFVPISSDAKALDGLNVQCAVCDEIGSHRTDEVYNALITAMGKRRQPFLLSISTATGNTSGIGKQLWDYGLRVLQQSQASMRPQHNDRGNGHSHV